LEPEQTEGDPTEAPAKKEEKSKPHQTETPEDPDAPAEPKKVRFVDGFQAGSRSR